MIPIDELLPDALTEPINTSPKKLKKPSQLFLLGRNVSRVIADISQKHNNCPLAWKKIAYLLALFNIQLYPKIKQETGRDGVTRIVFFMNKGSFRPSTSFKLPTQQGVGIFSLPDNLRLMLTKTFHENSPTLGVEKPGENFDDEEERKRMLEIASILADNEQK